MVTRRRILQTAVGGLALGSGGLYGRLARAGLPPGAIQSETLERLQGKQQLDLPRRAERLRDGI